MLGTGTIPRRDNAHAALDRVLDAAHSCIHRTVRHDPVARRAALKELRRAVSTADEALARSLARNGAVGELPVFFAERSVASPSFYASQDCACGWPTRGFAREGRLASIMHTTQTICDRCGDIENGCDLSCTLRASGAFNLEVGSEVEYGLSLHTDPDREYRLGFGFRHALRISEAPAVQAVRATETTTKAIFRFRTSTETRAEAEYLLPFAVSELAFAVGRVHVRLFPTEFAR
ncbi:MAG: hypothetical protein NTV28_17925 [Propionibacteriales bacterium]|nr:hypothetical protein [Propionibacteriales bacterium]